MLGMAQSANAAQLYESKQGSDAVVVFITGERTADVRDAVKKHMQQVEEAQEGQPACKKQKTDEEAAASTSGHIGRMGCAHEGPCTQSGPMSALCWRRTPFL